MGRMKKAGAAAAAVVLTMGLVACGDDDDADATDDTEAATGGDEVAAGDADAFCGALVDFNAAANDAELDEDASEADVIAVGERLAPLGDEIADNAPEAVADGWGELNDSAIQPLLEGDAEGFNDEATFETYTQLVGESVEECDFEELSVTAVDYAFEGVPETLSAGTYVLELTNEGSEEHEMIVFRKAEGVTASIEEIVNLSEEESEEMVVFSGAAFAPPGETGSTLAELDQGEYGVACFIPVGGGEDGPPHFTQGMLAEFTVE